MDTETQDRPHVIKDAKGKRPSFFESDSSDQLMSMVMVIASELNTLRDRVDAQERVAKLNGIDMASEIDKLALDEAALQEREAWRQGFFERLFYLARKEASEAAAEESSQGFQQTIADIAEQ